MKTVLFACVHNAGRSQMAAAWFNRVADPQKARAISAGTDPGTKVHPEVVAAMSEVGVDLSGALTTRLTPELAQQAQVLVTMGWMMMELVTRLLVPESMTSGAKIEAVRGNVPLVSVACIS